MDSVVGVAVSSGAIGVEWCNEGRGLTTVRNPFRSSGSCCSEMEVVGEGARPLTARGNGGHCASRPHDGDMGH